MASIVGTLTEKLRRTFERIVNGPYVHMDDKRLVQELANVVCSPYWSHNSDATLSMLDEIEKRLSRDGRNKHPNLIPVAEVVAEAPVDKCRSDGHLHNVLVKVLTRHATVTPPENPWKKLI